MPDLNKKILEIINGFDKSEEPFSEVQIWDAIRPIYKNKECKPSMETLAEVLAINFVENFNEGENPWGTYFRPMYIRRLEDGKVEESPSIKQLTPEILDYWKKRVDESLHPVLKSRYSNLVWDFSKKITNNPADHRFAQITIDCIIDISNKNLSPNDLEIYIKLKR